MGIYSTSDRIDVTLRKIRDSNFSERNKELLKRFTEYLMADDMSDHKIYRYVQTFRVLEPVIDFQLDEAEKHDLIRLVGRINQDNIPDKNYSAESKAELKKAIRRFYKWQDREEDIGFISTNVKASEKKRVDPDELPTDQDVDLMIQFACNKRDKALISTLWESGARIGELLTLDWKDVAQGQDMYRLVLDGKTGMRKVPICDSIPYLDAWEEEQGHEEGAVFTSLHSGNRISYGGIRGQLEKISDRAGVSCKTNPHAFRKSRATFLASNGANVFQLMNLFGWTQAETAKTYVRLAQSDVDDLVKDVSQSTRINEL